MTLKIEIPDETTAVLAAKARVQGLSTEQYALQVLEHDVESGSAMPGGVQAAADIILSHMRNVPEDVMAGMPKDGASQHDHYIYGWPKREP